MRGSLRRGSLGREPLENGLITFNKYYVVAVIFLLANTCFAQNRPDSIYSFKKSQVIITVDKAGNYNPKEKNHHHIICTSQWKHDCANHG